MRKGVKFMLERSFAQENRLFEESCMRDKDPRYEEKGGMGGRKRIVISWRKYMANCVISQLSTFCRLCPFKALFCRKT